MTLFHLTFHELWTCEAGCRRTGPPWAMHKSISYRLRASIKTHHRAGSGNGLVRVGVILISCQVIIHTILDQPQASSQSLGSQIFPRCTVKRDEVKFTHCKCPRSDS